MEALLRRVKNLADSAGHLRFAIPKRYSGKDGSNLWMAVIREHFASKGLGCTTTCRTSIPSSAICRW